MTAGACAVGLRKMTSYADRHFSRASGVRACCHVIMVGGVADLECESVPSGCGGSGGRRRDEKDWRGSEAELGGGLGLECTGCGAGRTVRAGRGGGGCGCVVGSSSSGLGWCGFHTLISDEKDRLFTEFYKIGDYNLQNSYLFSLISRSVCQREYVEKRKVSGVSRRKFSFTYSVKNSEGLSVRVCSKGFRDIFGISRRRLSTARGDRKSKSAEESEDNIEECSDSDKVNSQLIIKYSPHMDKRGQHGKQKVNYSELEKSVIEHIKKFPLYQSHYTRKKCTRKFIRSVKSVAEMYRLYKNDKDKNGMKSVAYTTYRTIFNNKFNIYFKMPHTDTCKVCDAWLSKEDDCIPLEIRLHQCRATQAYNLLTQYRKESRSEDCDYCLITFDLQKALPTPKIPTEVVFYLRQLWVYNLGIHICNNNSAIMCMWPENVASRGASEICSCLFKIFSNPENTLCKRKLRIFSDSCAAQNKNNTLYLMYYVLVMTGVFDVIEHHYLVPGHTFLPCDSDFGIIDKKIRKTDYVFSPEDWYRLVQTARVKNPFRVEKMMTDDFFDFQAATSCITRKQSNQVGQKMQFRKIVVVKIEKEKPGLIQYKTHYSSLAPWEEVQVIMKSKGRPPKGKYSKQQGLPSILRDQNLKKLYPNGRKIAAAKHKDLMSMLAYIPSNFHHVYNELRPQVLGADEEVEEDPDS